MNKMDKVGADFYQSVSSVKERLGIEDLPLQVPFFRDNKFVGMADLLRKKTYIFDGKEKEEYQTLDYIPTEIKENFDKARDDLVMKISEYDKRILGKYLNGEDITDLSEKIIRERVVKCKAFPILCGTSFKNMGVKFLIDAIVKFLPSPLETEYMQKTFLNDEEDLNGNYSNIDKKPFCALAFKSAYEMRGGGKMLLTFIRIYSGVLDLEKNPFVLNSTRNRKERISRILRMHANKNESLPVARAGDVVAVAGLKGTYTGDTLCSVGNEIVLEKMKFAEPIITFAIEPNTRADSDNLQLALQKIADEDPTFSFETDESIGQIVISGMGELHLMVIIDRLVQEMKVNVTIRQQKVAYKETLTKKVESEEYFKKQTGGPGSYAHIFVRFEPCRDKEFEFVSEITGGSIPQEFIPEVEKGIKDKLKDGLIAGYPVINVRAILYHGAFHEVDSSKKSFEIAGSRSLNRPHIKSAIRLLEPVMNVEIDTPPQFFGDIMKDIKSRHGKVVGQAEEIEGKVTIKAHVPAVKTFGYITTIRSLTGGKVGSIRIGFSHYERMRAEDEEKITGIVRMPRARL